MHTKWLDVAGNPSIYPVFDALRSDGKNGRYTFPDQAPAADLHPCGSSGRAPDTHGCLGAAQRWTPNQDVTLIGTAGHLHPGGLDMQLRDTRAGQTNTLFTSKAHYYEPAGEVSWDVSMGATPPAWRVQLKANQDTVSVHATYDTSRADWYEVMGIMPVAVYNGTDVGGNDAQANDIPQDEVLTHSHLAENDNHGGEPTGVANPLSLPSAPVPNSTIGIQSFTYQADQSAGLSVPTVEPGQSITFHNADAIPSVNAFHTITACHDPCTAKTGVAYPIANGPVTFDSGELGFNGNQNSFGDAPAADRDTWQTPKDLPTGTYTYFCRIHPFMRGAFRVEPQANPRPDAEGEEKADALQGGRHRDRQQGCHGAAPGEAQGREEFGGLERGAEPFSGTRRQAVHEVGGLGCQDQDQAQVLEGGAQEDQGGARKGRPDEDRRHSHGDRRIREDLE